MFIVLKHTDNYKGILIITHLEYKKFIHKIIDKLSNKYYIYGHWCNGYPSNLKINLATYYTDNIFLKSRPNDENFLKFKKILSEFNIKIENNFNKKSRYFDFIHIGRACERKNQLEVYNIMKKSIINEGKRCLLVLIKDIGNDKNFKYLNNILNKYNNENEDVKKNLYIITEIKRKNIEYCINNSFTYEELAILFNYSKIYIHSVSGFDEARIIGQALLSGCLLLCKSSLSGHKTLRTNIKDAVVEYNNSNELDKKIKEILQKLNNYTFNNRINNLYNEDITVIKELKNIYNNSKYDMPFNKFVNLCDKKLWSLKVAGHYENVYWNVKKDNEYLFGNPTHHIQDNIQLNKFFEYINS